MPEVIVHMAAGRSPEQKKALMMDISQAVVKNTGAPLDAVTVSIIEAPLTDKMPEVSLAQSIDWICDGMRPLGDAYVAAMRRGLTEQRWVGGRHLRLRLARDTRPQPLVDAIAFNQQAPVPARIRAAYRLDVNEFQGTRALQLIIEHWEPC